MKIVVTSDWHVDHVTHGVRRFDELRDAVHRTVDVAIEEGAAAYVFAGDLCDPDSGSCVFRCVRLALEAARRLEARGIRSFWVAGNHDVIEDGSGDTTLTPLRALEGTDMVRVFEEPGLVYVREMVDVDEYRAVGFAALPFTATSRAYDVECWLAETLRSPKCPRREDLVIVSHLTVPGVEPGEETKEMPRGREVVLPGQFAASNAKVAINGHYHRQQRTAEGIWIPGSLARLTFCEEKNEPGYLVIEV